MQLRKHLHIILERQSYELQPEHSPSSPPGSIAQSHPASREIFITDLEPPITFDPLPPEFRLAGLALFSRGCPASAAIRVLASSIFLNSRLKSILADLVVSESSEASARISGAIGHLL